jgi:hypothetical protein
MHSTRVTILSLAVATLLAAACSDKAPGGNNPSDAGGTGLGGVTGTPGLGGSTGGGASPGNGGSGPAGGSPGTGGAGPGNPLPGGLPSFDGGLPNFDAGLPGLIDAGVVAICPAQPAGKACGGQSGGPIGCVVENSQPPQGCVCLLQQWVCPSSMGQPPGLDAGLPIGRPPTPCPANAQGTTCPSFGAVCTGAAAMSGCVCIPGGGGALTWICR